MRLKAQAPNDGKTHTCVTYVNKNQSQKEMKFMQNPPALVKLHSLPMITQEKLNINKSDAPRLSIFRNKQKHILPTRRRDRRPHVPIQIGSLCLP